MNEVNNMFKKRFKTDIAGISHHKKEFNALDLNRDDYVVELVEEPTNKHDPNAIKVIVDGHHIGYIPAKKCTKVKTILHSGTIKEIRFVHDEEELGENIVYENLIYIWYK